MADPATMMVASTVLSAGSSVMGGVAADKAASSEAKQLRRNANARVAQGTRDVHEIKRDGKRVESDAVAAMAGGGSAFDAGMAERLGDIGEITDYNALAAMYEAETDASGLRMQAKARRKSGQRALATGFIKAGSTVLDGASKYYGPKT